MVAENRLRIAYSFPFRLGSPGIGAAALSQIEALAARGCEVQVFCWSSPKKIPGVRIFQTQRLAPVPQRLLGRWGPGWLHDVLTAGLLKFWSGRFDVVHTWPLAAEQTLNVARARGELGVREAPNTHTAHAFAIVAEEHRALGVAQEEFRAHTFNAKVLEREMREYEAAALILAPSELAIETFVEQGVPRSKLALKSYGFDPLLYTSSAGAKANDAVTFSFIARCEPRKGLHLALEAWHQSGIANRSKFRITGRYVQGYRERILPLLQHPNVSEHDFVSDLRPLYGATDILTLPSIEDGSALVTYEAQASGCALLVSDASGARFTDGVEGYLHQAGDVGSLARQMQTLVEDPALLARMQRAGPLNAAQYTWERATESLVESYKAALCATAAT